MGYCVDIELRNVKFKKSDWKEIHQKLIKWNDEHLQKRSDRLRFDSDLSTPQEIFEEMRYEAKEADEFIQVTSFWGEKLGSDETLFGEILAPYLSDCEIVYEGEDGHDWKQVIKDHKVSVVTREAL